MESQRFDDLTRRLAKSRDRRGSLRVLAGTVLAGGATWLGAGPIVAAKCKEGGKKCDRNSDCCSRDCKKNGKCKRDDNEPSKNPWSAEKLKGGDVDHLKRRADDDRDFGILRDYFGTESGRNWRERDKLAIRILKNDKRQLDAFWITYKNPGEEEWAHVMLSRDDNGREESEAFLWRGSRRDFSDRFYVQNGNLRREDVGRVDANADVAARQADPDANPWVCAFDAVICGVLNVEVCLVGTAGGAAICKASGGTLCSHVERGIMASCMIGSSDLRPACQEFAGEECQ